MEVYYYFALKPGASSNVYHHDTRFIDIKGLPIIIQAMDERIYHGSLTPETIASALTAQYDHGNLQTQIYGRDNHLIVQIATRQMRQSGGQTALTVDIEQVPDGVMVKVGEQDWLGVAASLGWSAIITALKPLNILNRLDDIAQDVSSIQMKELAWRVIDSAARSTGASQELSRRLKRMVCEYCNTANPVGQPRCIACGAPLGDSQPTTCSKCGFIVTRAEKYCPNCKSRLS
jgi:RNase P subunit RPR2